MFHYKLTIMNVLIRKMQTRKNDKWFLYLFLLFLLILMPGKFNAQQSTGERRVTITGKVLDESGEPVIGGSVLQKGTSNGAVTNIDGDFSLDVPLGATITISYLGFLTEEIVVRDNRSLTIILKEDVKKLDEVVVIGLGGTRKRGDVTGAYDGIVAKDIENRPVTSTMQALQGLSPNLIIQNRNANPNDQSMNVNVRGVSTMNDNSPLIVIDGLSSSTSTLNNMNPDDIESITILKDAGSAAIYGSRSAGGVVLVTTKQGTKTGKPVIKFSSLVGYEDPRILFQPVKGYENALLRNQANINSGSEPSFTPAQIRDLYDHQDEEYWYFNEIMQKALKQNYNMSVQGGNANTTYLMSAGYFNQGSNYVGNFGLERYNFRSNVSTEYGRFKMTTLMSYNRRMERTVSGGTGNVIINSSRIPPYYYYKFQENGKWLVNNVIGDDNTMAKLKDGGFERKAEDNIIGQMSPELKIMEGLKAKGMIGIDLTQHQRFRRYLEVPLYSSGDATEPTVRINPSRVTDDYNSKSYTLTTQFLLDFERTFNASHGVTAMLGTSNESYSSLSSTAAWQYTNELGLPDVKDATTLSTSTSTSNDNTSQWSITSIFGRAGYNYLSKYYFDFTFRYDGSSRFAKDYRWGFFPSFSGGWRISEEGFMNFYRSNVGDLKVRGSYGILGNQSGVGNYAYQTTYSMSGSYAFDNTLSPRASYSYGNPLLTWEKTGTTNIGVDATFLKNKLFVSFDYFNKNTWDILLAPVVPSTFGNSVATENAGKMQNRGWEISVNYNVKTGAFNHRFNFNLADTKNKVIDFRGDEQINSSDEMSTIIREGTPFRSYYGLRTAGYFKSYEEIANSALHSGAVVQPGDVKFIDTNGDGIIDSKDRVILGNGFPRYTFGFTYDISYKGFDLNMLFQGVGKRDQIIRGELVEPFHSNYSYCIYQHQLDFWTPTNPDARWPRLVAPGSPSSTNNWGRSGTDIFMLDGAYLRLKNIQFGYTLPKQLTSKIGIQRLRINLNAQNLLTLTKNAFVDPESTEFGSNMGGRSGASANSARNYPTLVYYGFGLNLDF